LERAARAFHVKRLAKVALSVAYLAILPERVVVPFGAGGSPDAWVLRPADAGMTLGLHMLLFFGLYLSPRLLTQVPNSWISRPNRDGWLAPERRAQRVERFARCPPPHGFLGDAFAVFSR
jgi:hypothetical protein